jgi:hypothetical protein
MLNQKKVRLIEIQTTLQTIKRPFMENTKKSLRQKLKSKLKRVVKQLVE